MISLKEDSFVYVDDFNLKNREVYEFLEQFEEKDEWLEKAIIIGTIGLKHMVTSNNLEYVSKEIERLINNVEGSVKKNEVLIKEVVSGLNDKMDGNVGTLNENMGSKLNEFKTQIYAILSPTNTESPLYQINELLDGYFNSENGELKRSIEVNFDLNNPQSPFSRLISKIEEKSGMSKDEIIKLLDSNSENSSISYLKRELSQEIDKEINTFKSELTPQISQILQNMVVKSATEEIIEKTALKGVDFEEDVYTVLNDICEADDIIEWVGNNKGAENKKTGDYVISINGNNSLKVVVECKNSNYSSAPKTVKEINEAIRNRESKFGIFLFNKLEQMPHNLKPVTLGRNYIITYGLDDNLEIAVKLARMLTLGDESDVVKIEKEVHQISEILKTITQIKKDASQVANLGSSLNKNADELKREIESCLANIRKCISGEFKKDLQYATETDLDTRNDEDQ
ncbi:hypothetical protein [Methanococcus maripaludis]|uniref:Uncharacterized protein n=2 Tax=Methanococcus maripaludis TaxID=39152 RepID=A0A7J9PGG3_METMI|nr:hypothetical protein [Methanococcus maripaludis]MBA2861760.1 hypothetical protein [Methanococcus maripaludis]